MPCQRLSPLDQLTAQGARAVGLSNMKDRWDWSRLPSCCKRFACTDLCGFVKTLECPRPQHLQVCFTVAYAVMCWYGCACLEIYCALDICLVHLPARGVPVRTTSFLPLIARTHADRQTDRQTQENLLPTDSFRSGLPLYRGQADHECPAPNKNPASRMCPFLTSWHEPRR